MSPFCTNATTDGWSRWPCGSGITSTRPLRTVATTEFVVPRSMPMTGSTGPCLYAEHLKRSTRMNPSERPGRVLPLDHLPAQLHVADQTAEALVVVAGQAIELDADAGVAVLAA